MIEITDEIIERAAEAAYMADIFRLRTESDIWLTWETLAKAAPTTAAERYRTMARAALTAVLGDVEPLEDVLGDEWALGATFRLDGEWVARVHKVEARGRKEAWMQYQGEASGPTIDAAIRAAIAQAKGEK